MTVNNLRSHPTFPTFSQLPADYDLDEEFFSEDKTPGLYRPRQHWCFLGEIVDSIYFGRLRVDLRDMEDCQIPVAFHTDTRGVELWSSGQVEKGNTMAVLYAQQHGFMDGTTGIRVEMAGAVKIFPYSLKQLMGLNDHIQRFSAEISPDKRTCHGCEKKAPASGLSRCARCSLFWYCNKACQTHAWKSKGHKQHCKMLQDADLRAMFLMDWETFDDFRSFPLSSVE